MKTDLKALRALCDAATDGAWACHAREADEYLSHPIANVYIPDPDRGGFSIHKNCNPVNNARFIAATDPQTVRALIDEIERLRGALVKIASFDVQWAYGLDENIEKIKHICEQALGENHDT